MEPVNELYIEKLEINNDYYNGQVKVTFKVLNDTKLPIDFTLKFDDQIVGKTRGISNEEISIILCHDNFKPWSPDEPNLYTIEANLLSNSGKVLDTIYSYTAIRVVESKKDSNNIQRIFLNGKPIFNIGALDQGYWPDGFYTPPSEEAMIYDIQVLKDLGYNTIRNHVKTEFFRYYYYCDKIGMLIWQDMPSGNFDGSSSLDKFNMNGGRDFRKLSSQKIIIIKNGEK